MIDFHTKFLYDKMYILKNINYSEPLPCGFAHVWGGVLNSYFNINL